MLRPLAAVGQSLRTAVRSVLSYRRPLKATRRAAFQGASDSSDSFLGRSPSAAAPPLQVDVHRALRSWVWRVPFAVSGSAVTSCAIIPVLYPVNFFTYANATLQASARVDAATGAVVVGRAHAHTHTFTTLPPTPPPNSSWRHSFGAATQVFLSYAVIYASIVVYGVRQVARSEAEPLEPSAAQSPFYYAFIVPNYKEEQDILDATVAHLAAHPYAARQFIVVLAMEEREAGAAQKAESLRKKFRGQARTPPPPPPRLAPLLLARPGLASLAQATFVWPPPYTPSCTGHPSIHSRATARARLLPALAPLSPARAAPPPRPVVSRCIPSRATPSLPAHSVRRDGLLVARARQGG